MPFAFREHGERSKVATHIKTLVENGADGKPTADQTVIERAKASAIALIESLPAECNGVLVLGEGQSSGNVRSLSVQVIGEKGHF